MARESERLALTNKYKETKKDADKIAFVTQYAGQSEKAMKKISAMSDDYTQKLSNVEERYFGKKRDPFDISFPYLDSRKKW